MVLMNSKGYAKTTYERAKIKKTDKRIAWPIIIMNFTGVYDYEAFARNNKLYGWTVVILWYRGYCDRMVLWL